MSCPLLASTQNLWRWLLKGCKDWVRCCKNATVAIRNATIFDTWRPDSLCRHCIELYTFVIFLSVHPVYCRKLKTTENSTLNSQHVTPPQNCRLICTADSEETTRWRKWVLTVEIVERRPGNNPWQYSVFAKNLSVYQVKSMWMPRFLLSFPKYLLLSRAGDRVLG